MKNEMNNGKLQVFTDHAFLWSATLRYKPHCAGNYLLRIHDDEGIVMYLGYFDTAIEAKQFLEHYDSECRWFTVRGLVED